MKIQPECIFRVAHWFNATRRRFARFGNSFCMESWSKSGFRNRSADLSVRRYLLEGIWFQREITYRSWLSSCFILHDVQLKEEARFYYSNTWHAANKFRRIYMYFYDGASTVTQVSLRCSRRVWCLCFTYCYSHLPYNRKCLDTP